MNRCIAALALIFSLFSAIPAVFAQSAASCQFVLGFAILHDALPSIVGNCTDDEGHNPANGDGLQHTVTGLLVWRKADNFTAFTDGYHSWVNGPGGVEERLNQQRFSWEANPDNLPVVANAGVTGPVAGDLSAPSVATATTSGPKRPGTRKKIGAASGSAVGGTATPDATNVAGHTFYASAHSSATLIYCDNDSGWHSLSTKSLRRFSSWEEAHTAYPGRRLHQLC